jgi:mono/diheme cytochrome c family protein
MRGHNYFLVMNVFVLYWLTAQASGLEKAASKSRRQATSVARDSQGSPEESSAAVPVATGDRPSKGAALFAQYCQRCHGKDGQGTKTQRLALKRLPDFTRRAWQESRSDSELQVSILDGKGNAMPSLADRLSKDQVLDLIAYIRKFNGSSKKSPKTDKRDFEKNFRQLEEELKTLQKEFRNAHGLPPKPGQLR